MTQPTTQVLNPEQIEQIVLPFMQALHPKMYLTRGANVCIIFTKEGGGDAPLIGVYYGGAEEGWISARWMLDGKFPSMNKALAKTKLDLLMPDDGKLGPKQYA
jgi:hypothetical protein